MGRRPSFLALKGSRKGIGLALRTWRYEPGATKLRGKTRMVPRVVHHRR